MMSKPVIFLFSLLIISFLLFFFFWSMPVLFTIFIILLWFIKYKKYPIKNEIIFYTLIIIFGGTIELSMVNVAAAWAYTAPNFFNIPIFMPFLWGFIGVTLISLYEMTRKKK